MIRSKEQEAARKDILDRVAKYCDSYMVPAAPFAPGDRINYAGRVYDHCELTNLVDASLDFWLTAGRFTEEFEAGLAKFLGIKHVAVTNSGSSANLLAIAALTAPELGERRLCAGDEVITVAAGFPTTVTPIVQYGLIPVFVDVKLPTCNVDETQLESAYSPKCKAVILAHTLGITFNLSAVKAFCDKYNLWLIEDNCDALGAEYTLNGETVKTGTVGDLGTSSFYPAHHMTMGEGGAVYTNSALLNRLVRSFRDWGRDCVCPGGHDNCCGHRFDGQYGELPEGYDHKYVYSQFGYNLKVTDLQAAIGCAQLKKLPDFVEARRKHWKMLRDGLQPVSDKLILHANEENSEGSPFGFAMTVRENVGITRDDITKYLENENIQTRNLFAGNFLRHPCFDEMRKSHEGFRNVNELPMTDYIMYNTFWIGVHPGMTDEMINYMIKMIQKAVS